MIKRFLDFPSEKDWNIIYKSSLFPKLFSLTDKLESSIVKDKDFPSKFLLSFHLNSYYEDLYHKLDDTCRAYIFMMHYFNRGLSDERSHKTPLKKGDPLEFYPDLSEDDAITKSWFDFYTDITYYKLFSVWDLLGHILNITFKAEIKENDVYFPTAVRALKIKNEPLYKRLNEIINSPTYKRPKKIRNDISHNLLPNNPGLTTDFIKKSSEGKKTYQLIFKEYIPSRRITKNIQDSIGLLIKTIKFLNQY